MVDSIANPETTPATIHTLASVIFVQEMDGSALAIMSPLLKRGMDEPATAVKRNVARIIENMAKLVDDPYEVEPFIPLLLPTLKRAKEEVSDPEARDVMGKAHDQLERTIKKPPLWQKIERPKVVANATELAGKGANADVLAHIAAVAHSLLDMKILDAAEWTSALGPHLALLKLKDAKAFTQGFLDVCAKDVHIEPEKEEADDAEQLCDCQFSLAYGTKTLLNQTVLKLKRGYRYGLCGRNDSGKTSLQRGLRRHLTYSYM